MSTDRPAAKRIPGYMLIGFGMGALSFAFAALGVLFYSLVSQGIVTAPPTGVAALWAVLIMVTACVPISLWAADVSTRIVRQDIAEQRELLLTTLDRWEKAIRAAKNAGQWEGFISGARGAAEGGTGVETGEVRQMPRRLG